jgi:hypothetical protein
MANQTNRGGQKQGTTAGSKSQQHRGVRPGSTTLDKPQRKKQESKSRRG